MTFRKTSVLLVAFCAFLTIASTFAQEQSPPKIVVSIDGQTIAPSFGTAAGSWFYNVDKNGTQILLLGFPQGGVKRTPNYRIVADLNSGAVVRFTIPASTIPNAVFSSCAIKRLSSVEPRVFWSRPDGAALENRAANSNRVESDFEPSAADLVLTIAAPSFDANQKTATTCAVEITDFQYRTAPVVAAISLEPTRKAQSFDPIETSPDLRPTLADALVDWDWRLQDGIGTEREPRTFLQALESRIPQGRALLDDLQTSLDEGAFENFAPFDEKIDEKVESFAALIDGWQTTWREIETEFEALRTAAANSDDELAPPIEERAEQLWRRARTLKREMLVESPLFRFGSLLFVKHAPGIMSHQLTQVYGYCARPGGGLFALDAPGRSMKTREITPPNLPLGSYMTPELSFDGRDLYFAFCETPTTPQLWRDAQNDVMSRRFHLYRTSVDGGDATRLTDGDFDDFSPLCLPDGDLIFCSTRRGGFHRCGGGPCYVYTLARSGGDGSNPRPISFHETNEWNPTLTSDGRVVYTRWDYVDRDAVYYQQLWSTRQDGTDVRAYYGNNTFNPCGLWETKAIPGSSKVAAIAGPHHGLTAGCVVLVDVVKGIDGPDAIERLTPEVRYPEGEAPLPLIPQLPQLCDFDYVPTAFWQATRSAPRADETSEERRWPVHCFKSPAPLSEKYFVASYSFDKLLGEAGPNLPNQFGLYFCDAFGNRELIYRDPNISSVWALPIRPRPIPPISASTLDETQRDAERPTGTFFVQNVYESWPTEIPAKVAALRVVQVLPKTTPNANQPTVGVANASPGKQVLGTVPVEEDGSAFFEAPAKIPLLFQALDEKGRAVQGMRSLVYLQPGESASCVGCHEDRTTAVPSVKTIASTKQPATIAPGPDGSKPLSFPILVQPVLDRRCVECHNAEKTDGGVNLTGTPTDRYTTSYEALVPFVPYTAWGNPDGNFEPRTEPNRFGARPSRLTKILEDGHYDVELAPEEWERLNVWQDANALFYGTFDPVDQERQQRGERIEGPALE